MDSGNGKNGTESDKILPEIKLKWDVKKHSL